MEISTYIILLALGFGCTINTGQTFSLDESSTIKSSTIVASNTWADTAEDLSTRSSTTQAPTSKTSITGYLLNTTGPIDIGEWGEPEYCTDGFFANAFQMKVDTSIRNHEDDTGMNAIRLFCNNGENITSLQGTDGIYKDKKACNDGFLNAFRVRVLKNPKYPDQLGATFLEMRCNGSNMRLKSGSDIGYGKMEQWKTCPEGWAISVIQTRIHTDSSQDQLGLTDVRFWCTPIYKEIQTTTEQPAIITSTTTIPGSYTTQDAPTEAPITPSSEVTNKVCNSACKFPFIYEGVTYNQCTSQDSDSSWCATETDDQNKYIRNRWTDCDESCIGSYTTRNAPTEDPITPSSEVSNKGSYIAWNSITAAPITPSSEVSYKGSYTTRDAPTEDPITPSSEVTNKGSYTTRNAPTEDPITPSSEVSNKVSYIAWNSPTEDPTTPSSEVSYKVSEAQCPQDFSLLGGQCLYVNIGDTLNWEDARDVCTTKNASLLVPAEATEFKKFADNNYYGTKFWLGASDRESEGEWKWLNGEPLPKSGFPWAKGEPSNGRDTEHCLMYPHNGGYNDIHCSAKRFHYICEATTPSPPKPTVRTPPNPTTLSPTTSAPLTPITPAPTTLAPQSPQHITVAPNSGDETTSTKSTTITTKTTDRCYPGCRNGGVCRRNGHCLCPFGFQGPRCEVQRCTIPNQVIPNSNIAGTVSLISIKCHNGFTMHGGDTVMHVHCQKGKWMMSDRKTPFTHYMAHCQPMCQSGCQNGGTCVAPEKCQCPVGVTGDACQYT